MSKSDTKARLSKNLKSELANFANRIEDMLGSKNINVDDLVYVKFFLSNMSPRETMDHVIDKMLPWKTQILKKDDKFFYKNNEIFGKLPQSKVNFFSDRWTDTFDAEDKQEIWDFLDTFIAFAEEYKKND